MLWVIVLLKGEFLSQCLLESRLNQVFLLPVISSILFLFILKNSPLFADVKRTLTLLQSALHQTLGEEFTFQQDNNLQGQIYNDVAYQEDGECF